jgi:hypothetical protein
VISFVHKGGGEMASYRYRAAAPSAELRMGHLNNLAADVLIFAKPAPEEVEEARTAKDNGQTVIVDFCDDHFDQEHYGAMAALADAITCSTPVMAQRIVAEGFDEPTVIPDPYEFPEYAPHCRGVNLLWFGHATNLPSLMRVIRQLDDYPLMVVSNSPMALPWTWNTMILEFARADVVVIPATAEHKSPNRAIESIRQGCFVVAEPHPSLEGFPGIWIGDLKEGIEWSRLHPVQTHQRILEAQNYVRARYSPRTQGDAWRRLLDTMKSRSTSEAGASAGRAGSTSMASILQPT